MLVEIDFPRTKAAQGETGLRCARETAQSGSFPTVLVFDSEGAKIGQLGYVEGGSTAFIAELEKVTAKARINICSCSKRRFCDCASRCLYLGHSALARMPVSKHTSSMPFFFAASSAAVSPWRPHFYAQEDEENARSRLSCLPDRLARCHAGVHHRDFAQTIALVNKADGTFQVTRRAEHPRRCGHRRAEVRGGAPALRKSAERRSQVFSGTLQSLRDPIRPGQICRGAAYVSKTAR